MRVFSYGLELFGARFGHVGVDSKRLGWAASFGVRSQLAEIGGRVMRPWIEQPGRAGTPAMLPASAEILWALFQRPVFKCKGVINRLPPTWQMYSSVTTERQIRIGEPSAQPQAYTGRGHWRNSLPMVRSLYEPVGKKTSTDGPNAPTKWS